MKKWSQRKKWIAGGAVALVAILLLTRSGPPDARENFESVRALLAQEHFDQEFALRRLDACLAQAELEEDPEVAADVLVARGGLLLEIGATEAARADFTTVLERYRPGDLESRRLLARSAEAAGDYEAARVALQELHVDAPGFGPGWVEAGLLEERLARAHLDQCAREISFALVGDDAKRARRLIERIAASDLSDSSRITAQLEFRRLFPPGTEDRQAVSLELADEASSLFASARDNYVQSFEHGLVPEAVAGYLAILVTAGELDAALDFGLVALTRPELAAHERAAAILIEGLLERGDVAWAAALAEQWAAHDAPFEADFLLLLARALQQGRRWHELNSCLGRIRQIGSSVETELLVLYRGLAMAGMGQVGPALSSLRMYVNSDAGDVYPGARADAWRQIALLSAKKRDPIGEREGLHELLRIDPDAGGELWVRLAELHLEARHSGYALPLDAWTRAMCALPRRTADLLPRFLELGELSMGAENKDLTLVKNELKAQNRIVPRAETNPYLFYGLARLHAEKDDSHAVRVLCEPLLEEYPGFVPALDLLIDAELGLGKRSEAAEHYVQRLELAGPDERARVLAARFADFPFTPEQQVRRMAADPAGLGRRTVARHLIARGDRAGALRVLQNRSGDDEASPQELQLAAGLLIEEGRFDEALEELELVKRTDPAFSAAASLAVEAALSAGRREIALQIAAAVAGGKERDKERLVLLGTTLARMGEGGAARDVMRTLDAGRTRDGRVLVSLGMAALAAGDLQAAETYIERAEAFVPLEVGSLARALVAARRGDNFGLEREVRELTARGGFERGVRAAAAALLVGDAARALELAAEGTESERQLDWALITAAARALLGEPYEAPASLGAAGTAQTRLYLRGTELAPADPRAAALALLALEAEPLAAYVAGELHGADPAARGVLWPRLLEARALVTLGLHSAARRALDVLVARFPDCDAAWRELEQVERARLRLPHHPELAALRERHLAALGASAPESPEGLLVRARTALAEQRPDTAASLARRALERREGWDEARATLATALALQGDGAGSLAAWASALLEAPAGRAPALVDGFLEALAYGESAGHITPTEAFPALQRFAEAMPDDPRLELALAERELARDDQNPSLGYARALSRLESFRLQHATRSLDDLHPGSTADWARFYVGLDPSEGRRFLEAELRRDPGNLALWVLYGRVLRQSGDMRAALEVLNQASLMAPEPVVFDELAAARVASGADPRAVRSVLERVRQLRGDRELSLTAELDVARARLRQSARGAAERAASDLEPFLEEAQRLPRSERNELAFVLTQALLRRDWPGDRKRALELVNAWAPVEGDPYRRSLAAAFRGLTPGEALRTRPPEPEPEAEEPEETETELETEEASEAATEDTGPFAAGESTEEGS